MAENRINYDEIQDEYLDNIIRLAYKNAETLEAQEILEESTMEEAQVPDDQKEAAFQMFLSKMERQENQGNREARIHQWKKIVPRIINVAACIVLMLGIAAPYAIANVEAIRARVMQMLIDYHEDHVDVILTEDENASFDVPADYLGEYYPSYLPDGCEVVNVSSLLSSVDFRTASGSWMYFNENNVDTETSYSIVNADVSSAWIHGNMATIIDYGDSATIIWSDGTYYFDIQGAPNVEEAMKMAESVRKIQR